MDMEEWVPDSALNSLNMERTVNPSETPEQMAQRIFLENLPLAAQSIAHLALHSTSERTRLQASQYIVERNLGRVGESRPNEKGANVWDDVFDSVTVEAENYANGHGR